MTIHAVCVSSAGLWAIALSVLAVSVQANEPDAADDTLNNSIGITVDLAENSRYLRMSGDRQFESGWYLWLEVAQEELDLEPFDSTRSYAMQLQRELAFPWLASFYASHWDGADAVETTVAELQINWLSDGAQLGLFIGQQDLQLTAARLQGARIERDFTSRLFGTEIRLYPTDALTFSARLGRYAHDFDPTALNLTERPALILFLSPDTFSAIDGLDNWSLVLDANLLDRAWLWGARIGISESAVEELDTLSISAYAEYTLSPALSVSGEITQQRTENYDSSNQIGIGARFSF